MFRLFYMGAYRDRYVHVRLKLELLPLRHTEHYWWICVNLLSFYSWSQFRTPLHTKSRRLQGNGAYPAGYCPHEKKTLVDLHFACSRRRSDVKLVGNPSTVGWEPALFFLFWLEGRFGMRIGIAHICSVYNCFFFYLSLAPNNSQTFINSLSDGFVQVGMSYEQNCRFLSFNSSGGTRIHELNPDEGFVSTVYPQKATDSLQCRDSVHSANAGHKPTARTILRNDPSQTHRKH